ncbi:MAG: undecaprenyldiphospho-muramoylpentapeptide beta-N-acetylglucosaminyltransferase [Clostridiales bacterium]|nr:undecaprenyldiphospho-muramoylpentapeptide beta-N-acetylglucosaminyltransferase [Clostridiales bacterium]
MKILIAGGGTAGHINPGIAIAKSLEKNMDNPEIIFVGTKQGLETRLVPMEGFGLELIKVRGFKRKISLDTLKSVKDTFLGICDAVKLIKKIKPDVVIGTGGYVCGPVLMVAKIFGIPTLIHESNAIPGVTNKILGRFVDCVCISFDEAKKYFTKSKKVVITGNPLRQGIESNTEVDDGGVVIFAGSRGSQTINTIVTKMINKYGEDIDFDLTFATGEARYDEVVAKMGLKKVNINIVPYIFDMPKVMGRAKLMVTRSGAITLAEITAMGKPSLLIPSPYVTANHQEYNARALEKKGASLVLLEKDLNEDVLYENIVRIIRDNDKREKMAAAAKSMGVIDANDKIFNEVKMLIK